jgi:hypothetical protein
VRAASKKEKTMGDNRSLLERYAERYNLYDDSMAILAQFGLLPRGVT